MAASPDSSRVLVYRVEHTETHEGPYRAEISLIIRGIATTRTPTPMADGLWDFPEHYLFGFESEQQALDWFEGSWKALHNKGYGVSTYEASCYGLLKGGKQLVFDPELALLIEHKSVKEWGKKHGGLV